MGTIKKTTMQYAPIPWKKVSRGKKVKSIAIIADNGDKVCSGILPKTDVADRIINDVHDRETYSISIGGRIYTEGESIFLDSGELVTLLAIRSAYVMAKRGYSAPFVMPLDKFTIFITSNWSLRK